MKNDLVLIITSANEGNVPKVISHLEKRAQRYIRINTDTFWRDANDLSLVNGENNGDCRLSSTKLDFRFYFSDVKSIWYRRPENSKPETIQVGGLTTQEADFLKDEQVTFLASVYSLFNTYWMNHPILGSRVVEHNKLYQMHVARTQGLHVPDTIVSNNPNELISFSRAHEDVAAIKVLKQRVFIKPDGTYEGIYTNKISTDDLVKNSLSLSTCPVMLQEYIEKTLELRITVVGHKIFLCAIYSQERDRTKIDWRRYDKEWVKHEEYALPKNVEEKLLRFMKACGLNFGAIDMILTPENKYVFLEVNPSGQYGWIEGLTGMPISEAIAEALCNPDV